jgi:chemotaxis protein methyltransferase CheR
LLRHRLEPVARAAGCSSFAALLAKLAGPAGVALREPIIDAITTKETSFFRDRHPFDTFRRIILPELAEQVRQRRAANKPRPARIWCAAVSTGQEAYSLAMLIDDYLTSEQGPSMSPTDFALLATDVSEEALAFARTGRFSEREVTRGVSPAFRERCFRHSKRGWAVADRLKQMVEFRKVNLMDNFAGLGMMDLIFCRNVLIYFDEAARRRICERFAEMLAPHGFLILGAVENLYAISSKFTSQHLGSTMVYRKPPPDSRTAR